jgi:hypothetical protein
MGFTPNSPNQSILVYKKKNHYNEWEFFYDPLADRMMGMPTNPVTAPIGGQQGGSPGAPPPVTTPSPQGTQGQPVQQ